jgi:hypothetical protein
MVNDDRNYRDHRVEMLNVAYEASNCACSLPKAPGSKSEPGAPKGNNAKWNLEGRRHVFTAKIPRFKKQTWGTQRHRFEVKP